MGPNVVTHFRVTDARDLLQRSRENAWLAVKGLRWAQDIFEELRRVQDILEHLKWAQDIFEELRLVQDILKETREVQ